MAARRQDRKTARRASFAVLLTEVRGRIQEAQTRAVMSVNRELVRLYWDIGRVIDERQRSEGWGAAVIPRLARALHNELPELKGFSERNIKRMLAFHREYPDPAVIVHKPLAPLSAADKVPPVVAQMGSASKVPQPVARLPDSLLWLVPWAHHVILMEKVKDLSTRRWYMEQTLANGCPGSTSVGMNVGTSADLPTFSSTRDQFYRSKRSFPKDPFSETAAIKPLTRRGGYTGLPGAAAYSQILLAETTGWTNIRLIIHSHTARDTD